MSLTLKGVPAVITSFNSPKGAANVKDGNEASTKSRIFSVVLDVTDDSFVTALDKVFPGVDMALKAAAKMNDGTSKAAAFEWKITKKLPNVTIKIVDKLDTVVVAVVNAKVKSRPVLRVALGVSKVLLPITIECGLDQSTVAKILDYQDNDVICHLSTSQMDIADKTGGEGGEGGGGGKGSKKGDKVKVSLVPDASAVAH